MYACFLLPSPLPRSRGALSLSQLTGLLSCGQITAREVAGLKLVKALWAFLIFFIFNGALSLTK